MKTLITPGMLSELRKLARKQRRTVHGYCVQATAERLASGFSPTRAIPRSFVLNLDLPAASERQVKLLAKQNSTSASRTIRDMLLAEIERNRQ